MSENYITIASEKGSINISEDVVTVIATAALAEVEGIAGFSNSMSTELYELLGKKPGTKSIKTSFDDGTVIIDITAMIRYGNGISKVASAAQSAVMCAVESMIGMRPIVNVHVSGVAFEKK